MTAPFLKPIPRLWGHAHRLRGRAAAVPARPGRIRSRRAGRDRQPPSRAVRIRRARDRAGPARAHRGRAGRGPACRSGRAAALVQQRLRDGGQALQRRIGSAYQGVADAWGLGLAKVPAVVVDRRYVVYGEPDDVARRGTHRIPSEGTAMNRLLSASSRRARLAIASVLLGGAASSFALNTATIVSSALSPDCLEYRVVGICYWLFCTWTGCTVRTSVKVRHYIPDAVVSSYSNTGENPWIEVRAMSMPNPTAQAGGDGTTNHDNENNLAKFKNADVIGHPGGSVFSQFASTSGYACQGAGTAFMPYLLSTRWPGATTYRRWCTPRR